MQKLTLDKNVAVLTSTGYVLAKDLQPFDYIRCVDGTERRPQVLRTGHAPMQKLTLKSRPSLPLIISDNAHMFTKRKAFHFGSQYRCLSSICNGQFLESTVDDGSHVDIEASQKSDEYWEMVGMLAIRGYIHSTFIEDEMTISLKLLDRHIQDEVLMGAFERAGFGRWLSKTTCANTKQVNELMELMSLPESVFTLSFEKRKALLKGLCAYVMPRPSKDGHTITHIISSSNWALLTAIARLTASITGEMPKVSTKEYQSQLGYSLTVTLNNPEFSLEIEDSISDTVLDDDDLYDEISEMPIGILDEIVKKETVEDCDVVTFILNTDRPIIIDNFSMCTLPLSNISQGMR